MKLTKYLVILPLTIGFLAGCNGEKKEEPLSDQEVVEKLVEDPTNLLTTGGKQVENGTTTRLEFGTNLIGVKKYQYTQKDSEGNEFLDDQGKPIVVEPTIEWSFSDKNWEVKAYKVDGIRDPDHSNFVAKKAFTKDEEYSTDITLKMTLNEASATATYHFDVLHGEFVHYKLGEYRQKIADKTLERGTSVKVLGKITGVHSDIYSGVYIQSGSDAVQLYAGNLSTEYSNNNLKVGDVIVAYGPTSDDYHGLTELKPSALMKATDAEKAEYEYTEPVPTAIAAGEFDEEHLALKDGALVTMSNLKFITIGDSVDADPSTEYEDSGNNHQYGWFKDSTDKVVQMSLSYHLDNRTELKELFASWTPGTTLVNFSGHLSWYDEPCIMPVTGPSAFTVL